MRFVDMEGCRMRGWLVSLSAKLTFIVTAGLFILFILISLSFAGFLSSFVGEQVRANGNAITGMFAEINRLSLYRFDYYAIESNVKELQNSPDVNYVEVADDSGFIISRAGVRGGDGGAGMPFEAKIGTVGGQGGGTVRVEMSVERTNRKVNSVVIIGAMCFLGIGALIGVLFRYLITRFISKPIDRLLRYMRAFSDGYSADNAPVVSKDEIGVLTGEFNVMTSKLRQSTALMRNIVGSIPSMLVTIDSLGKVTQWNAAASRLTGVTEEDALGREVWGLAPLFARYREDFSGAIKTGTHRSYYRQEIEGETGQYYNIETFPVAIGQGYACVIRVDDVTEAERTDAVLRQAQKMESIGALAGGIAHDFNNVLGGILGTTALLKMELEDRGAISRRDLEENLGIIDETAIRARDVIRQLLTVSRKQEMFVKPFDLRSAVSDVVRLCESTFDKSVEIKNDIQGPPAVIHGDIAQIEQAVLNVMVNAKDALTVMRKPGDRIGGRIAVCLESVFVDRAMMEIHAGAVEGPYWCLKIEDNGVGMDRGTMTKLFEPFFTTKVKGKGTGLGLAMVFNSVHFHNGFIAVYSEKGEGSAFKVFLPAMQGGVVEKQPDSVAVLPRGSGKILLIDDNPAIRNIALKTLERCGYSCLVAQDGEEGLREFRANKGTLRAVLLDMIMPKMSGYETYEAIRAEDPDVPVVIMSGFRQDERVQQIIAMGDARFIEKPFTIQKLAEIIASTGKGRTPSN